MLEIQRSGSRKETARNSITVTAMGQVAEPGTEVPGLGSWEFPDLPKWEAVVGKREWEDRHQDPASCMDLGEPWAQFVLHPAWAAGSSQRFIITSHVGVCANEGRPQCPAPVSARVLRGMNGHQWVYYYSADVVLQRAARQL